jgi:thiamine-monophosphate kinase
MMLSLPRKISVEMVKELYDGALQACKKYSCLIVGGDTTASLGNMSIAVTLTGEMDESSVVYRSGAKVGDYICVTGHLGGSFAGLKVLQREKERFVKLQQPAEFKPNFDPYTLSITRHLVPQPRLDISSAAGGLIENVKIHSMIDISDGLASEVHHICSNSNVGADIYEHNIPVHASTQQIADEFGEPVTEYALYGGEEYELLFTIDVDEYKKLENITDDVSVIGRITAKEKGVQLIRENGEQGPLQFKGWNHFK